MSTKSPLLPRLRSTAKYSEFKPAALATSKPNFPHSNASTRSLGAISSNQNASIILFSIAQPYEPLLVYHSSHHTSSSLNLKFSKDSKLLGASYDSSLLIYDCTGEALQPLRQRVSSGTNREHFRSLLWKDATEDGSNELITCTESSISQWDLRTANRKPVITFACESSISVAHSSHQIGAMAASGVVKVFDDRACNSNKVQSNEKSNFVYEFQAHGTGMGIESSANHWLTWGLDDDMNTSVKVYKQHLAISENTENYWYVENENEDQTGMTPKLEKAKQLKQVQCISATNIDRVTAVRSFSHVNHSKEAYGNLPFLTMSMSNVADMSTPSWQADLWSFSSNSNSEKIDPATKISSFCGGGKNDAIAEICGKEYTGSLIAAELSWIPEDILFEEKEGNSEADGEIVLCCLTNTGYLTTFALPEVVDIDNSVGSDEKTPHTVSPFRFISSRSKRESSTVIFGTSTEKEEATQVKSFNPRIGRKRGKSDADLYANTSQTIVDLSTVEGGNMQFDLDDEYDDDKNISESQVKEEVELQDKEANNGTTIEEIDPEKASRVPCPRMCSAVFGMNGRLVSFHNGNVSNMWNWYTSDFQVQSPSHLQHDISNQNTFGFRKMEDEHFEKKESELMSRQMNRIFPRSAWDMMKMNEAAKVAQWGKDLNDDDSNGSRRGSSSSESDGDSSDDSDSDDDSSESDLSDGSEGEAGDMYERYFGIKRSKVDGKVKPPVERKKKGATRTRSESFVGPVTENLEPQVFLTDTYQDIAMAGQCSELADSWLLGPYLSEAIPETALLDSGKISPRGVFEEWTEDSIEISNHEKLRNSMIGSLHQLYYNESKGDSHVPKAHVPMDQKLMQKEHSVRRFETESESKIAPMKIVEPSPLFKPVGSIIHDLRKRRDICLHNARSSISLNEKEKADVWNLIAEIIEGISDSDAYDDFDGWHSFNGNALGQELLLNIFQYYEMMGDVQMLASILSVLKYRRKRQGDSRDCDPLSLYDMLLPNDPLRYDRYIHYYSALLYSWGKLSLRAEMTKHLSDVTIFSEGNPTEKAEGPHQRGIFSPVCQECNARANPDTNICRNCHRYAFKCSICTNVVRGLFTVCSLCGHGGHMAHLMSWHLERSDCPTGCGCNCSFKNIEIST